MRAPFQPDQSFKIVAQAPIWNGAIHNLGGITVENLRDQIGQFSQATGHPVLGYLTEGYFHMTQYPESRSDRPPMLSDEENNDIAGELAKWLGGIAGQIPLPAGSIMATVGRLEGYEKTSRVHGRDFAHRLFDPETAIVTDGHMIAARFQRIPSNIMTAMFRRGKGELVQRCHDEPVLLVRGDEGAMHQVREAAYKLGQWHIPVEDYRTGRITMYETALARRRLKFPWFTRAAP